MARQQGDPSDLIRRLEAALKVAKRTDIASAEVMSDITGMTWRNLLKTHIEPDTRFPIRKRGAEGVPWEFEVVRVLKHMVKRAQERMAVNEERAKKLARLTGFDVPEAEASGSVSDLSKLIDANLRAQKAKEEQRRYIPAEKMRMFLSGYNRRARDTLLGQRQKIDPLGTLPPEIAEAIEDNMRNLAVALQEELEDFVEEFREAVGSGGAS